MLEELKASQKEVAALQKALAGARVATLAGQAAALPNGAKCLAASVEGLDAKSLQVCWVSLACILSLSLDPYTHWRWSRGLGVGRLDAEESLHACCTSACVPWFQPAPWGEPLSSGEGP